MGYYIIQQKPLPTPTQLATAALMKFQQFHVIEKKPAVEINVEKRIIQVCAGETMTFTWEELGF